MIRYITVHKFRAYDITLDENVISASKATQEWILRHHYALVPNTAEIIDARLLSPDELYRHKPGALAPDTQVDVAVIDTSNLDEKRHLEGLGYSPYARTSRHHFLRRHLLPLHTG